jgi:DNA mismatch endonuclease (patch repair protein)
MNTVNPARSAQMALVRGRDTKPEMRVRKALHAAGLRYRLHDRRLPGVPDLVFPSRHVALFVHGCFWHRHPGCAAARLPKSRLEFWEPKLSGNAERDKRNSAALEAAGWKVMVIWECETRDQAVIQRLVSQVQNAPVTRRPRMKSA